MSNKPKYLSPWLFLLMFINAFSVFLWACPPSPASGVAPPVPESDADPCAVAEALTQERMIRDPSTGKAMVVPCDSGIR